MFAALAFGGAAPRQPSCCKKVLSAEAKPIQRLERMWMERGPRARTACLFGDPSLCTELSPEPIFGLPHTPPGAGKGAEQEHSLGSWDSELNPNGLLVSPITVPIHLFTVRAVNIWSGEATVSELFSKLQTQNPSSWIWISPIVTLFSAASTQ